MSMASVFTRQGTSQLPLNSLVVDCRLQMMVLVSAAPAGVAQTAEAHRPSNTIAIGITNLSVCPMCRNIAIQIGTWEGLTDAAPGTNRRSGLGRQTRTSGDAIVARSDSFRRIDVRNRSTAFWDRSV